MCQQRRSGHPSPLLPALSHHFPASAPKARSPIAVFFVGGRLFPVGQAETENIFVAHAILVGVVERLRIPWHVGGIFVDGRLIRRYRERKFPGRPEPALHHVQQRLGLHVERRQDRGGARFHLVDDPGIDEINHQHGWLCRLNLFHLGDVNTRERAQRNVGIIVLGPLVNSGAQP